MADWNTCPAVERKLGKICRVWVFAGIRIPLTALDENLASGDGSTGTDSRDAADACFRRSGYAAELAQTPRYALTTSPYNATSASLRHRKEGPCSTFSKREPDSSQQR